MSAHVFGIRHHGPGSARSLAAALAALSPDVVLVEGPPDADELIPLVAHADIAPPVALLIYVTERPERAAFYPFALFSPEWQALGYALAQGVPARFIDLPQSVQLASEHAAAVAGESQDSLEASSQDLSDDPLGLLAEAAGYSDRELWWEHHVEQRRDPTGVFEGIRAAMQELRKEAPPSTPNEARREAFMRTRIRAAEKEGFQKIAVICGAWHVPALVELGPAKGDQKLLKDLPKTKVTATWIPWTYSRLSYRSGYGAGVASPGWYEHLWNEPSGSPARWLVHVARVLREKDLDASSANVIEATRLAEALAALREIPMPGLREVNEAALSVICQGDPARAALIRRRLEIGDVLGRVPAEAPAVPLQRDLEAQQKRLRLKRSAERTALDLDLRQETGRDRSVLLHRLRLLGIEWGRPENVYGKSGTFHEAWSLQWEPELAVRVIESALWGTTVEAASSARAADGARRARELDEVVGLLERTILAQLPSAIDALLTELQARAALSSDIGRLISALPPLARIGRYGDVRGTRVDQVLPVYTGLFQRVTVGLPTACASLDDAAAANIAEQLASAQESVTQLDIPAHRDEWREVLRRLLDDDHVHGLVRGRACRLLLDQDALPAEELDRRARLALSPAVASAQAAAWAEGLLKGSGLLLLHQDELWRALDEWLVSLKDDDFQGLLPLLRRAFSGFTNPERRQMGDKVKHLGLPPRVGTGPELLGDDDLDHERARLVLPVLAHILGVSPSETEPER